MVAHVSGCGVVDEVGLPAIEPAHQVHRARPETTQHIRPPPGRTAGTGVVDAFLVIGGRRVLPDVEAADRVAPVLRTRHGSGVVAGIVVARDQVLAFEPARGLARAKQALVLVVARQAEVDLRVGADDLSHRFARQEHARVVRLAVPVGAQSRVLDAAVAERRVAREVEQHRGAAVEHDCDARAGTVHRAVAAFIDAGGW